MTVKKNDRLTVFVEDLTHDGQGVAKVDGYPIFIKGALPDEKVEVHVVKALKKYGFAKLIEIEQASPFRVAAPCPVFDTCGGCQLQHLSYEGQLMVKEKQVRSAMERIGKVHTTVLPVMGMDNPWRYRNKSQIPFGTEDGRVVAGFYKSGSHDIADTPTCLIQSEEADRLMLALKERALELGLEPYDEKTGRGQLRHLVVRKGQTSGETMVVLVTKSRKLTQPEKVIQFIRQLEPSTVSIVQNINPTRTNVIFGEETFVHWGKSHIVDSIGAIQFEISARSFYQINPIQTNVLYQKALEAAGLTGTETVMDAFCGIGTISLFLAQQAKQVLGVEIVPQAVEDARRNAELNGFTNAEFEVGAAEDVITKWYEDGKLPDVVVVDPPRKGLDGKLIDTLIEHKPRRIVYVSCNPATLARDLRLLEDGGYTVHEVQPVDMFPHTTHVECVTYLTI
ncbi:23S rRNA (uracil(1939)-C(5))-methyltransferase RlmD [Chryseomicrobium sp. FSL W7-1435]|uniref:23S rRNA (uracil(1939)-C(5))-methyltransferase RlmD n=1 Tax=Chryseomicrobium sp. FSL W7-1435 TaxID=2921704 RepID=UPI00315A302D